MNVSRPSASTYSTRPSNGPRSPEPSLQGRHASGRTPSDELCRQRAGQASQTESEVSTNQFLRVTAHRHERHRRAADERCHERVRGTRVDGVWVTDLLETSLAHDRDPVAHRHRLDLIVRDVHRRRPHLLLEPLDLASSLGTELRIEIRKGLVHQEHLRLDGRARDRGQRADAGHRRALVASGRGALRCRAPPLPRRRADGSRPGGPCPS